MKNFICLLISLTLIQLSRATDAPVVDKVRFQPAPGQAAQMVGGRFAGSNQGETFGFETLAVIDNAPAEGQLTELSFSNYW